MTDAALVLLTLLAEKPRHGYELEQVIDERGMREWNDIGFSSIYYVLRKLETAGYVEALPAEAGARGPSRTAFRITRAGLSAAADGVHETLAELRSPSPFMLGLSAIVMLPRERALDALRAHRGALAERLDRVADRREEAGPVPLFVDDVFDYSVTMLEVERRWVSRLIRRYEKEA